VHTKDQWMLNHLKKETEEYEVEEEEEETENDRRDASGAWGEEATKKATWAMTADPDAPMSKEEAARFQIKGSTWRQGYGGLGAIPDWKRWQMEAPLPRPLYRDGHFINKDRIEAAEAYRRTISGLPQPAVREVRPPLPERKRDIESVVERIKGEDEDRQRARWQAEYDARPRSPTPSSQPPPPGTFGKSRPPNRQPREDDRVRSHPQYQSEIGMRPPGAPWEPVKKLTFAAMAGLKQLHKSDPKKFTREGLAADFGISYEAVSRILKSDWRDKEDEMSNAVAPARVDELVRPTVRGTKWDTRSTTTANKDLSPVAAIVNAFKRDPAQRQNQQEGV